MEAMNGFTKGLPSALARKANASRINSLRNGRSNGLHPTAERLSRRFKSLGMTALLPAAVLMLWWLLGQLDLLNPYLTPPPGEVWRAALESAASSELWQHTWVSLARVFGGFALTSALALPLAALLYFLPWLERMLAVPLEFIRVTPPLAAIPLLILWFGIGEGSKLAIIILASFFPIFLNVKEGLKNTDAGLLEMAETIDLTRWDAFRHVLLPSALPSVITGLRIGFGYSWRALIGAELIAAASGLGYMILDAEELARTDRVFLGIFVIGGLGYTFDALFSRMAAGLSQSLHLVRGDGGAS
jgi:sulfonate transport system permease protein